jgi:hypothetical protein
MSDVCAMLAIAALPVTNKSVPLVPILWMAMEMKLVAIALAEGSVIIQEAPALALLASSERDANTKPLSCNHYRGSGSRPLSSLHLLSVAFILIS